MSLEHADRKIHKDTQAMDQAQSEDMIEQFCVLSDMQFDARCTEWKTIRNREGL
jgi:hypothetical protein